ncbi:MAG: hypothetical protein AB1815_12515 [Bacillota bacterium]
MRKPARTFEDLLVWQKAHLFALAVYLRPVIFIVGRPYNCSRAFLPLSGRITGPG